VGKGEHQRLSVYAPTNDMLRVLIHHVHGATLHAHALLPREIAKEKLFKMLEGQSWVQKRKCENECGNVQYDYDSDDGLNDAGVRYCDQCERDICHDCGIKFCDICHKSLCFNCMKTEDWRVCDSNKCGPRPYCTKCECEH
jgi:hypothetical protein